MLDAISVQLSDLSSDPIDKHQVLVPVCTVDDSGRVNYCEEMTQSAKHCGKVIGITVLQPMISSLAI